VSFSGTGQGYTGDAGKVSWSAAWVPNWDPINGALDSLTRQACGLTTPDSTVLCPEDTTYPVCEGSDRFVEPDAGQANKVFTLPQSQNLTSVTEGYAMAACYCPGLGGCDAITEFVQQIGVLYIFATKVCDSAMYYENCVNGTGVGSTGVAPGHSFKLMVNCAPGGCTSTGDRIKLIDAHADNDRPSWDAQHGCHTTNQTALQSSPVNCASATSCELTQGTRQDYKLYGNDTSAFALELTGSSYERLNFNPAKGVDVCFCSDSCSIATNWFKVGSLVYSPYLLLNLGANLAQTVNVAGKLGFFLSDGDINSVGLGTGGLIKILQEQDPPVDDAICGSTSYDTSLVPGFSYTEAAAKYSGTPYSGDSNQLVFDSGVNANTYTFSRAGIVAICYCRQSWLGSNCPEKSDEWVLAANYVVKGPATNQAWTFSTGIAVRLTYQGFGLTSGATLRLAPSNVQCTDLTNDPITESSLQDGCPYACQAIAQTSGARKMNLVTTVLAHNTVDCGVANTECDTVYVNRIVVLSATSTQIEFSGNPGLATGDRLVLGDGIKCGTPCSTEQLTTVTGAPAFGNSGYYNIGNPVTATSDANRFLIPVGWSGVAPKFEVLLGRGHWTRSSAAATREELKGTEQKVAVDALKACWGYGGDSTYVIQVGTVSFVAPPIMTPTVSLTTREKAKAARIVISFTTGSNRPGYAAATNSMLLRIVFTDISKLEPHFTNGNVVANVAGWDENEQGKASQAACGKLFHELWSTNPLTGFPMPKGCYYRLYGQSRELCILFEKKNPMMEQRTYQVVLTATAKAGIDTTNPTVEVISMEDIVLKPYEAVEAGSGTMNVDALDGATGSNPQFAETNGFTIISGTSSIVELKQELDLKVRLAGKYGAGIVKASMLRLFMFPLTQWNMQSIQDGLLGCLAECTPFPGTVCPPVKFCSAEAVVANSQRNTIRIQFNDEMTPIEGMTKHVLRIHGFSLPEGGFFPSRIGAELSQADDSRPDYVISSGDYLWKAAGASSIVAELVTKPGDGNSKPFQGQAGNILHAHFALGTTLFVDGHTGSASMTIELPPGYTVTKISNTPNDLGIFTLASNAEEGNGILDTKKWLCSGRTCTYTLEAYGTIFAGSSFYLSFTVTNPSIAMLFSDAKNKWYLSTRGSGAQITAQNTALLEFRTAVQQGATAATSGNFQTQVAVLGTLTHSCIQPTDFRSSTTSDTVSQDLYIFFQTQQSAGFGAYVVLDAPVGFNFKSQCYSADLAAEYYSTTTGNQTYPLPGILGCLGSITIDGVAGTYNKAFIEVLGHLRGSRRYGFRVRVDNPESYTSSQQQTWRLFTMTSSSDYVDGSQSTIDFQLQSGMDTDQVDMASWGVYREALTQSHVAFHVAPLLPYSVTMQEATITVFPLRSTTNVSASLRISAPHGYVWYFADKDFIYTPHSPSTPGVTGATAALPGKVPTRSGNTLEWSAAYYEEQHTYGFITYIRVPDFTPTHSSNVFFVEFGYNDHTWTGQYRSAAVRVEADPVRALRNAKVDYTSRIKAATNVIRFTVETATAIAFGGGLVIFGPEGFRFSESCNPTPVADSVYKSLPPDSSCEFQKTNSGKIQLTITAGETGVPPGIYTFNIAGVNPVEAQANLLGENTECGTTFCWTFHSLENAKDGLASTPLEKSMSTTGFAITDQMLSAMILPLDEAARDTSGRNDRPLVANWVTFTFQLAHDVTDQSAMILRGPIGFIFPEDCFANGGVRTRLEDILGTSTSPVEAHTAWEPSVPVYGCEGNGPVVKLAVGAGLRRLKSYIFSIRVQANPASTPEYNKWMIEMPGESSAPFDGFITWTFTETSISYLSTAVSVGSPAMVNLVNVTFRPHHDLDATDAGNVLMLTAPAGYVVATDCNVHIEERDPLWPNMDPVIWNSTDILQCLPGINSNILAIELMPGGRTILARRLYTWMVELYNPTYASPAGLWELKSFKDRFVSNSVVYDTATFYGLAVNKALDTWQYTGTNIENGGVLVNGLVLTMVFPDTLNPNDLIHIEAPSGYDLGHARNQDGQTECYNLGWGPGSPAPVSIYTKATCRKNRLVAVLSEDDVIMNGTTITLQITTTNPALQPPHAVDYWHVRHLTASGNVASSSMLAGWKIVPQLQDVQISITGKNIAAGSTSILDFNFIAASPAVTIVIEATAPPGFDFGYARLSIQGQTVKDSVNNLIRAKVNIVAGVLTTVRIQDVRLAIEGGVTQFNLKTYADENTGSLVTDQRLNVVGFRLPGSITVSDVQMLSEFKSTPATHPVKSRWPPQYGKTIEVRANLIFSNPSYPGHLIQIKCPTYSIFRDPFIITDSTTDTVVPVDVSFAAGDEARAQLQASLLAGRQYSLMFQVKAPLSRPASDEWTIQITDGGSLPVKHTFATMDSFPIISELGLKAETQKSPPAAEIEVSLLIVLGKARPTLITIMAPPTFEFKSNCIIASSVAITSCNPGSVIAGRPTAQLTCTASDLTDIVQGLKIAVTTPPVMPTERNWFVEVEDTSVSTGALLGWGEDATGIVINPMQDVSIVYAGIPDIQANLAITFRTSETINRGGTLNVVTPSGFVVSCLGTALEAISLPVILECEVSAPVVSLIMNDTLTPGDYAFIMTVRTPSSTPANNQFSVLLKDERGKVQDSAMNLPGQSIHPDLSAVAKSLEWTSSEAGQASTITVGFKMNSAASAGVLGAILITFPENFGHAIEKESSVVIKKDQLPLKQEDWLDFRMVDRLIVLLDPAQAVAVGDYEIEFPVTVPEQLPANNVWQVTLCEHSDTSVCLQPQGSLSLVTFPFAGFTLSDVSSSGQQAVAGQAHSAAAGLIHCQSVKALWLVSLIAVLRQLSEP
jgi:hypothetical protein